MKIALLMFTFIWASLVHGFDYKYITPKDISFARSIRDPKPDLTLAKDFEFRLEVKNRYYRFYGLFEQVNEQRFDGGGASISFFVYKNLSVETRWYKRDVYNLETTDLSLLYTLWDIRESEEYPSLQWLGACKVGLTGSLEYWRKPEGLLCFKVEGKENYYRIETNFRNMVMINVDMGWSFPFAKVEKKKKVVSHFYYCPKFIYQSVNENKFEWQIDTVGWKIGDEKE